MAKVFLFAALNEQDRLSGRIQSALGSGATDAAARLNVVANKPSGEFDEAKFARWASFELADGTVTLPGGATAVYLGYAHGAGLNPLPGK